MTKQTSQENRNSEAYQTYRLMEGQERLDELRRKYFGYPRKLRDFVRDVFVNLRDDEIQADISYILDGE